MCTKAVRVSDILSTVPVLLGKGESMHEYISIFFLFFSA